MIWNNPMYMYNTRDLKNLLARNYRMCRSTTTETQAPTKTDSFGPRYIPIILLSGYALAECFQKLCLPFAVQAYKLVSYIFWP